MDNYKEKLYKNTDWDFTTLYGFYLNINNLIKPNKVSYEEIENKLEDFKKLKLNCESNILIELLLKTLFK